MANEIEFSYRTGAQAYALVRNRQGQIWNTSGPGAFENYSTPSYPAYPISCTEQGTASAYYVGNFPAAIPAGSYSVVGKQQIGGNPAETDQTVAAGNLEWNGTAIAPITDIAASGVISPIRIARGCMVANFPIYLKSAADHVTPFTSGIVSGQIARDNGAFGPLQSGTGISGIIEIGLGWYSLVGLTSGDLLANAVKLQFTATGCSGGQSDPLPIGLVLQPVSGSA